MKHKSQPVKWDYVKRTGAEQARTGAYERDLRRQEQRQSKALELVQASRPLRQGQASRVTWLHLYGRKGDNK